MSPLARSLLALALAALLHAAGARVAPLTNQRPPPALPGRYCDTRDIGNATDRPSKNVVKVTQLFYKVLEEDEYMINIYNYCSNLKIRDGKLGMRYVMVRETVTVCAHTPVHVLDVGPDVFSPVVAVCEVNGVCGKLEVKVDQYCEKRAVAPNQRPLGLEI